MWLLMIGGCESGSEPSTGTGLPVTLSGQIRYQDREIDRSGFTGVRPFKPIRFAELEVVRNADSQVLASGSSEGDGTYRLTFTNPGEAGIYIRVLSRTFAAAGVEAEVRHATQRSLFAVRSAVMDDRTGESLTVGLDVPVFDDNGVVIGGPFNILDVLTDGAIFVRQVSGRDPAQTTVFWEFGGDIGTFFNLQTRTIHLLGGGNGGDTDEYDDAIILHEYAHFIAALFSLDSSPGGVHILTDHTQDIRLSWSEGWAHFFSSAVRGDPAHMDTIGSDPPNGSASFYNLEGPSPNAAAAPLIYSTNELSVAAILWDIFDTTNESFDTLSLGMPQIWDVLTLYLCNPSSFASCPNTVEAVSLEDFWDGWFIRGHNFQAAMTATIQDRQVFFFPDSFEDNDLVENATPIPADGTVQSHTLFGPDDIDYISFQAVSNTIYALETFALSNGADPFLQIVDTDGVRVLASNDDEPFVVKERQCGAIFFGFSSCPPNDATTLAARLTFTAPTDGTFFARISRSPDAPLSAGVYGAYQFRIIRQ